MKAVKEAMTKIWYIYKEVELVDIEASALDALVNFCYSGEIKISDVNVLSILPAACLLQLNEVQEQCCEFLKNELDLSNCLGIRAFAETYACRELLRCANKYILHNFQDFLGTEEFLLLPFEQLLELITREELHVRSEEQLLEHVRLSLCPPAFLVNIVTKDSLVRADAACRDLVDEAKNYQLLRLSAHEQINMQGQHARPRKVFSGEILYAVGGLCERNSLALAERLNPGEGNPVWQSIASMSTRRFDPVLNRWLCNVAPMSTSRRALAAATLNNFIYAVGGSDGTEPLDIVERYDIHRNEWSYVAPLSTRRRGLSVSVLNNCLYAVGGSDGQAALNTVERLDPRVGKWQAVHPMPTCRKYVGSAVFDDHLYAVGGEDESDCILNSAEKYNPVTNEWTAVAAMNKNRYGKKYGWSGCDPIVVVLPTGAIRI
ncbi:kelch repeat protein [Teladorsagia circumcincta]|uniref:Kelch repeat protein n=1 Tax=Teladorsagia circumcincta TaxID=45464 RepID=A0A2G9UI90_TELCI|nr:kelch repeat protein [Teladorsagia circumcincta]